MITQHEVRTGTDFIAFYTAGRVAGEYGISHTYDVELQKSVQDEILGFSIPGLSEPQAQPLLWGYPWTFQNIIIILTCSLNIILL